MSRQIVNVTQLSTKKSHDKKMSIIEPLAALMTFLSLFYVRSAAFHFPGRKSSFVCTARQRARSIFHSHSDTQSISQRFVCYQPFACILKPSSNY